MIETERLYLRPFGDEDRARIAEINAHPDVAYWLGFTRTRAETDAWVERVNADIARQGFGFWAAERKGDRRLVGAIGLLIMDEGQPCAGAHELAWRLHPDAQGQGLASEGARACRDYAFNTLNADIITAVTAVSNLRSRRVMESVGLTHDPDRDFDHPKLAADHPLRPHVFYSLKRQAHVGPGGRLR